MEAIANIEHERNPTSNSSSSERPLPAQGGGRFDVHGLGGVQFSWGGYVGELEAFPGFSARRASVHGKIAGARCSPGGEPALECVVRRRMPGDEIGDAAPDLRWV